jgi:signal peptidase II
MKTQKQYGRYLAAIALFAVLLCLDLMTKLWSRKTLPEKPLILIKGVFEFRYLENRGAAFGLLQNQRTFFIILTVIFLAAMIYVYVRIPSDRKYLPLRLLVIIVSAGAFGNFYDRLTLTYVRDFLYFSLIDFPIFNVADIYVTCSAVAFFVLVVFVYKEDDLAFMEKKK